MPLHIEIEFEDGSNRHMAGEHDDIESARQQLGRIEGEILEGVHQFAVEARIVNSAGVEVE